jgi:hypothetical protein
MHDALVVGCVYGRAKVHFVSSLVAKRKISASRVKCKIQELVFEFFIAEAQPDLSKISASRVKCKIQELVFEFFIAETPPDLFKISASRVKCKIWGTCF